MLMGKRVLIVEDEYFIASDLKRALDKEAAVVVGPAGNLELGLSLAMDEALDAAVLDVNLEGATSFAIADRLARRGVPFVFLTGYDGWSLPPAYRDRPRIAKPFSIKAVLACLDDLIGTEVTS